MKGCAYLLNLLLCAVWGLYLAVCVVCKSFAPATILPALDVPVLLAVCLAVLLLERWLNKSQRRSWMVMTVLAAAAFGLLALCAGVTEGMEALKLAVVGGGVFLASGVLFDSMTARISTGPHTAAACPMAAFLLFLAGQGLANVFF